MRRRRRGVKGLRAAGGARRDTLPHPALASSAQTRALGRVSHGSRVVIKIGGQVGAALLNRKEVLRVIRLNKGLAGLNKLAT